MRILRRLPFAIVLLAACIPQTEFRGQPTTPQGPATCQTRCQTWGMELVGMVSMGENYTDGCICAVPGRAAQAMAMAPVALGGVVGVELQRRRNEEQRRQQQQHQQHFGPK
jgi:hypothetical protein